MSLKVFFLIPPQSTNAVLFSVPGRSSLSYPDQKQQLPMLCRPPPRNPHSFYSRSNQGHLPKSLHVSLCLHILIQCYHANSTNQQPYSCKTREIGPPNRAILHSSHNQRDRLVINHIITFLSLKPSNGFLHKTILY